MYNINNNSSIHQTCTRIPARTRTYASPADNLMFCGISNHAQPACCDCRFFETCLGLDRDQSPEDECQQGECRRHPPVIDHVSRDAAVNYAEFPIVVASDWCGEFVPRAPNLARNRDREASAALRGDSQQDATDANLGAAGGKCQSGREMGRSDDALGTSGSK